LAQASWKRRRHPKRSRERLAEPGDEVGAPVAQGERQRLVMQHPHPGVAQAGDGQLVHHPVADHDAAPCAHRAAGLRQLGYRGGDGGSPRPRRQVVDRLVDRVDQPEPVGLQLSQRRRLSVSSTSGWSPYRAWVTPRYRLSIWRVGDRRTVAARPLGQVGTRRSTEPGAGRAGTGLGAAHTRPSRRSRPAWVAAGAVGVSPSSEAGGCSIGHA
jgi:hypothetical protein